MAVIRGDSYVEFNGATHRADTLVGFLGGTVNPDGSVVVDDRVQVLVPGGGTVPAPLASASQGFTTSPAEGTVRAQPIYDSTTTKPATAASAADAGQAASLLRQYGLDELVPLVGDWIRQGLTFPQIQAMLLDRSSDAGKIVDRIYPELRMTQENGLPPVSIDQVQQFRSTTRAVLSAAGMLDAVPDVDALARDYITTGKSTGELQQRLTDIGDYALAVATNDPTAREQLNQLQSYYGVAPTKSDLVAFALTGDEPALHRKLEAASIAAKSVTTGYGQLGVNTAEGLAAQGVTADQAQQGFGQLAQMSELFNPLPGQPGAAISQDDQLAAEFGGNANAQRRIKRTQQERTAGFQGGGAIASSSGGFVGIGSAA